MSDQLNEGYAAVRQHTDQWQSNMLAATERQEFTVPTPEEAEAVKKVEEETRPKEGVEAVMDALQAEQELTFGALTGTMRAPGLPERVPLLSFMDKLGATKALDSLVELTGSEEFAATVMTLPAMAVGVMVDPLNLAGGPAGKAKTAAQAADDLVKQGVKLSKSQKNIFTKAWDKMVTLYHGSPHKFEKFSTQHIGKGEGAQAYGHGLYFAENIEVAKNYVPRDFPLEKKLLRSYSAAEFANDSDMMEILEAAMTHDTPEQIVKRFAGRGADVEKKAAKVAQFVQDNAKAYSLYEVAVPKASIGKMLDWDKPLTEQSAGVQAAIKKLWPTAPTDSPAGMIYEDMVAEIATGNPDSKWVQQATKLGFNPTDQAEAAASAVLNKAGIPGIKYLDQGSRGAGQGTSNFVLFDENLIKNVRRNEQGAVEILKSERGSISVGGKVAKEAGAATQPTWQEAVQIDDLQRSFDDRLATFTDRLSKQRRGVRSDVQVGAEASALQQDKLNLEGLLKLEPGTILNDAEVVAVKQMFKDTAEPVRQLGVYLKANPGDQQAFLALLKQLENVDYSLTKIAGVYAESGRTQRLLAQGLPTKGMVVADTAERVRISDTYINQWLEFFQKQDELAKMGAPAVTKDAFVDMIASLETPDQLARMAKGMAAPGWGDMLAQVYIQSLLSGLAPVKNIMGNPVILASQIAMRGAGAGVSAVTGVGRWAMGYGFKRDIYFGEVGAMLRGAAGSLDDAMRTAWRSMVEGRPLTRGESVEPLRNAITGEVLGLTGMWGRFVDVMGHIINLPGTALLGGDELFKTFAWRAEQRALALRTAHEMVNASGATGEQASRMVGTVMKNILDNPTDYPSIREAAQNFATYVTLQQELGPLGKSVQTWATTARTATGLPVGRFVMPFTTIATNAPRMAGEHSPLALVSRLTWDEILAGGARRDMALAKIAVGTGLMTLFADLASQGIITGAGPREKSARMHRKDATGWQATSIRIGGDYVSVQSLEPWSTLMSTTADLTEMYAHAETVDQQNKVMAAMIGLNYAVSRNVFSKTYLMGAVGLGNAALSGDIENWEQYKKQIITGLVPFSGALRQMTALKDPVLREAVDAVDAVKRELPGWSEDLRPMRNFWAEEIIREGGFGWDFYNPLYTSRVREDKVSAEFTRLEYFPTMPSKQIDGVPLDERKDGEYDAYIRLSQGLPIIGNQTLHQRLEQMVDSPLYKHATDGPDGGKVVLLRGIINDYRNFAQAILKSPSLSKQHLGKDFPELRAQFDLVEQDRAQRFNAPSHSPALSIP